MKITPGEWVNGYGAGITGPNSPTIVGPTVKALLDCIAQIETKEDQS